MKITDRNQPDTPMYGLLVDVPRQPPGTGEQRRRLPALLGWVGLALLVAWLVAGCATPSPSSPKPASPTLLPEIRDALSAPGTARPAPLPPAVAQALVPPADLPLPKLAQKEPEPRFDLNVSNLPVTQVFAALAKDTRYSMLVDPALAGSVTVSLKDVTLIEALDTLRDLYGYEYRLQGSRIFVQPAQLATRVYQVNYLTAQRAGRSDVRVTSGSITAAGGGSSGSGSSGQPASGSAPVSTAQESSRITTQSRNDLWSELDAALRLLVGAGDPSDKQASGRQVIVSPQSGVIVVRAYPKEQRAVEQYLRASRLNIERQVMLESKIVEVRLREGQQSGVNWQAFVRGNNHRGNAGPLNPGTQLGASGPLIAGNLTADPGVAATLAGSAASGLFGLAFQTSNFAALLQFLETQGEVQVLSSPRIAAVNNQKAVLKVGTDDFFVTGITTNIQTNTGSNSVVTPTITVQPFFSGIALDVTPQIDEDGNILLHVHPSVSSVSERTKVLNLGSLGGSITLPLASSTVSETDTVVRVRDGHIVAIGGLMKTESTRDRNQLPGLGDVPVVGQLFGSRSRATDKQELVILIKPTVIHSDAQADALRAEALERIESITGSNGGRGS